MPPMPGFFFFFFFLIDVLIDFIKFDFFFCGYRLKLVAPVIVAHGLDYERGKFKGKLERGTITTAKTEVFHSNLDLLNFAIIIFNTHCCF